MEGGEHLKTLLRRIDFLQRRIGHFSRIKASLRAAKARPDAGAEASTRIFHDYREEAALRWAVEQITGESLDPVDELEAGRPSVREWMMRLDEEIARGTRGKAMTLKAGGQ